MPLRAQCDDDLAERGSWFEAAETGRGTRGDEFDPRADIPLVRSEDVEPAGHLHPDTTEADGVRRETERSARRDEALEAARKLTNRRCAYSNYKKLTVVGLDRAGFVGAGGVVSVGRGLLRVLRPRPWPRPPRRDSPAPWGGLTGARMSTLRTDRNE